MAGPKILARLAGEGHLVGVAGSSNALEVEDEEGKRVLVGGRELRNGLEDGRTSPRL